MKKEKVKVHIRTLDIEYFDGPLESIIQQLQKFYKEYPGYDEFSINSSHEWESVDIEVYGHRLETDKEYNKRVKREELVKQEKLQAKITLEKKERKELARLKDKYETPSTD